MTRGLRTAGGIEPDGWGTTSGEITETELHDVLSNERRIALLRLLREESPRELGALAEAIAIVETGEEPPPRNIRQSVYITLHQTHLPKLDELGLVEYEAREKVVALAPEGREILGEECNDGTAGSGLEPFFALGVGGLLATAASGADIGPFSALSLEVYAIATLLALLLGFAYRIGRDGSRFVDGLRERSA